MTQRAQHGLYDDGIIKFIFVVFLVAVIFLVLGSFGCVVMLGILGGAR